MPQLDLTTGKVPARACCFAADVEVGTNGDGAKTAPISVVARSGQPVETYWWGRVVHDLAGMTVAKPRIPFDYCHDDEQVIGYANRFDTSTGDLVASGALVPYSADPCDKATEVLYKSQAGIPYQASIYFDGPLAIEEVSVGASAMVNGYSIEGPATIVRQWTLRGIAICPYGVDGNTSAEMSKKLSADRDVAVRVIKQETKVMSSTAEAEVKVDETKAVETAADANKPADAGADAQAADETVTDAADNAEATTDETKAAETAASESIETAAAPAAGSMSDRKAEGKKFRDAFGDKGPGYYADGLTFAEAQAAFTKDIADENKRLSKEVADLKTQLSALRGEKNPVSFSADQNADGMQTEGKPETKHRNLSAGLAKFAGNMRFVEEQPSLKSKK